MGDALVLYSDESGLAPEIACDRLSGLPLLSEEAGVLRLILNYLPLPYSVVEFGCGQKASIVLRMLALQHGIPPFALQRGLVMERDLSPEALAETDPAKRPLAITAPNTLALRAEPEDLVFRRFLEDREPRMEVDDGRIRIGDIELRLEDRVQFVVARSHVFTILSFWDEKRNRVADRVIDLTLDRSRLFPIGEIREKLAGPESWILRAPLMGRFRLDPEHLTERQRGEVAVELGPNEDLRTIATELHSELFRTLSGAPRGSVGDPDTWSSVNNVHIERDGRIDKLLREESGKGEFTRDPTRRLLEARAAGRGDEVEALRGELLRYARELGLRHILQEEADRCEDELAPLALVANTISCYRSLRKLAGNVHAGEDLFAFPLEANRLEDMHGIGVRLRRRIEKAAQVSRNEEGRIDARALNDRYFLAVAETIRQMNRAGLTVFADRVGNLHGLWIEEETARRIDEGRVALPDLLGEALCFGSHIDTVADAGKYDGRLGVFSGIEIVQVLTDLARYFERDLRPPRRRCPLAVSVFTGEEMTFTGRGVSLPGSAAVAGFAEVERVLAMTNDAGERYGDRLAAMGAYLLERRSRGEIELSGPDPAAPPAEPFASAHDPTDFLPGRFWERHIEQGRILHRRGVPMALTETIVGIRHEDFHLSGEAAEIAGWELIRRCRELVRRDGLAEVRLTCGVFERGDEGAPESPGYARRWRIRGASNHAGTTHLLDRRDAGVAAARLVRRFLDEVGELDGEGEPPVPLVGEGELVPGANRNVIPGEAVVVLGLRSVPDESTRARLDERLEAFLGGELALPVEEGGEGVEYEVEEAAGDFRSATRVRVSTDLRDGSSETIASLRASIGTILEELAAERGIEVENRVHQDSPPVDVAEAGVVLLMERSYGGSHNPKETELAADILRGTLFQLAVTCELLGDDTGGPSNLHEQARDRLPEPWRDERGGRFVSGGLHDSANLAMRVLKDRA